jgi:uncharacterized SAM-binding protein YcdF (DUF218 family)
MMSGTQVPVETHAPHRPRPRWHRRVFAVIGLAIVVFVAASFALFVWPPTGQPRHVDAIVSFNGPNEGARESLALSLAKKGYAPVLLFSQGGLRSDTSCPSVPRVRVVCFVDAANNTRGEARWAAHYANQHHWRSLLIVPGRPQATRARLLVGRCFPGQVVVVPAAEPILRFPFDILHEWGGLAEALIVNRSC